MKVEKAKVEYVDADRYTLDLISEDTNQPYLEVPFAGLYAHTDHAGGVYAMPEVGSYCYVLTDSVGSHHVMGFIPPNLVGDQYSGDKSVDPDVGDRSLNFRRQRPLMEPGDVFLGTADGNQIWVRRGGLVQIESTPLCQSIYIPIHNTIRHYFQQLQGYSPLGEFEWGHPTLVSGEEIVGDTAKTPVLVKYSIKHTAQEDVTGGKFTVELRAGQLNEKTLDKNTDNEHIFANADISSKDGIGLDKENAEGVLSLVVYSHSSEKTTYTFQLSQEGDLFMRVAGHLHVEVDKTAYVRFNDKARMEFGQKPSHVQVLTDDQLEAKVETMVLRVIQKLQLESKNVVVDNQGGTLSVKNSGKVDLAASKVLLGAGAGHAAVLRDTFGAADEIGMHSHIVNVTLPNGVPLIGTAQPSIKLAAKMSMSPSPIVKST